MKFRIADFAAFALAGLAAAALYAPASLAQTADQTFVRDAASGGMAEVKLGQLAQQNGSSTAVKDFGQKMEQDHSKADEQLKDAASQSKISIPSTLNKSDQATYDRLSKLTGTEFDKAYAQDMVKDHEKDVSDFKKEAADGQNPQVKQFASQTLPTLQDHLKMAQEMQRTVSGERKTQSAAGAR